MDRLGCVDVPSLPLQLLLQQHPDWSGWPAAVVDEDKPQGLILWVNGRARAAGVLPGLRYGPALSLLPTLRAGTIGEPAIQAGSHLLLAHLRAFSPAIERVVHEPGVFWLDAGGFEHLFLSPLSWAQAVRQALEEAGFVAAVVVGFRRFGTYAAAKALRGRKALVFDSQEDEEAASRRVPLSLVGISPAIRDALATLGVERVGDFLALPAPGIRQRFGGEAHQLHRFASGDGDRPLQPTPEEIVLAEQTELGYGEGNAERLVFLIKPLVDRLLVSLGQRGWALTELQLRLALDGAPERQERIRTAEPTLTSGMVMELVKLRLAAAPLPAPAIGLTVSATWVAATAEQLRMFAAAPRRDPGAAARAFARLRAAFGGEGVVVKAVMRARHSPEGSFSWEPLFGLALARPRPPSSGTLVRRILAKAEPWIHQPLGLMEGELWRGTAYGPIERLNGPYRLSGGWWRTDIQRDYYFAEMRRGELHWVFYDRDRQRWFLQGEIL